MNTSRLLCDVLGDMRKLKKELVQVTKRPTADSKEIKALLKQQSKLIEEAQVMATKMENRLLQYKDFVDNHMEHIEELNKDIKALSDHKGKYKRVKVYGFG